MRKIILFLIILLFFTYPVQSSIWIENSTLINGLDSNTNPIITTYNYNNNINLIKGQTNGLFNSYTWNGSIWNINNTLINGLNDVGDYSAPYVFNDTNDNLVIIIGDAFGNFVAYNWNGSYWNINSTWSNGLFDIGSESIPCIFNNGNINLISGNNNGQFNSFTWNGSGWDVNNTLINGLNDVGSRSKPRVYYDTNINLWKLISGSSTQDLYGYTWNGSGWDINNEIINGMVSTKLGSIRIGLDIFATNNKYNSILYTTDFFPDQAYYNGYEFKMNSKSTVPILISEPNYHLNQSITVQWINSTDSDGDAIYYNIKVGTTSGGTDILNEVVSINESSSFNINQFNTYYWSVRSNDTYEVSDWSTEDSFSVTNAAPVITNVTISPDPTAVENNLTALNNTATDTDGDPITLYYKWYKNTILQPSLTTSTVGSSNTSNGELWKVGIIPNDGYENGTEVQSQTVEIGSSNSAPTLTGVNINITYPMKRYVNFTITSENAADPNNDPRKLEVGSATGLFDLGIGDYFTNGNESNITIAMPFYDGLEHTLYIRLNDSNLTSQEYTLTIESDITKPVLNSESLSAATGTQGTPFGITINTTSLNSTIKTITVNVARPDATSANWTLTNTVNDTWYYNYLSTSDIGTYTINSYTITDASDNIKTASSSLSATITAAVVTEGGGGGGGGSTTIIVNGTIGDLTITPPRLDTYVLYGGFGEDRMLKYRFITNREVISCLVEPSEGHGDIATCNITDGYIVDVYLTINDSKGYSGTLTVRDSEEFVTTSDLIVRVIDIGAYIKIVNIPVGEAIASILNPFFASANGVLIGIRAWIIGATIGVLGLSLFKSDIFE